MSQNLNFSKNSSKIWTQTPQNNLKGANTKYDNIMHLAVVVSLTYGY